MNFSPYMDTQWKSRFYQSDLDTMTYNGQLLAIPMEQGPVIFYFNKGLLQQAGVNRFPTWDEFFAMADKLKKAPASVPPPFSRLTTPGMQRTCFPTRRGGGRDGRLLRVSQLTAMVKAASMLQKLFQYAAADAVGGKWAVSVQDFVAGRTAVIADGRGSSGSWTDR